MDGLPSPHNKVNEVTLSMTLGNGSQNKSMMFSNYFINYVTFFTATFTVSCLEDKKHRTNNRIQKLNGVECDIQLPAPY
jgi:hypothetical protein